MKMKRIILLSASVAIACAAGLHLSCDSDPSSAGNGSDTPNAALGKLVYANGDPAAGANVTLYASGADPRSASPAGVAVTGSDGRYVLTALEAGPYNVLGAKDNARSFSASNDIAGADTTVLPTDTLRETGSVCGVVKLVGDIDTADIYLLVLGTGEFAEADTGGRFCLDDMAPGEYSVRILTTVTGFGPKDTTINVQSGVDITLLDTVWVNSSVIPVPRGLALHYDTLRQIVTLTWNQADTALVSGYNVYRRHQDSGLVKLSVAPITDTIYSDSAARQDETYTYQLKALDKDGDEGPLSSGIAVEMVATFFLHDSIGVYGTGTDQLFMPRMALPYGTGYVVLDAVDPYPCAVVAKVFDSSGSYLRSFTVRQSNVADNVHSFGAATDSQNNLYCVFRDSTFKHDVNGNPIEGYALPIPEAEILSNTACIIRRDSLVVYGINRDERAIVARNLSGDTLISFSHDAASVRMNGIAVDANGSIFVGDQALHRIYKFSATGSLTHEWGTQGTASAQFGRIEGITIDPAGRLYVDDSENSRIAVFTNHGGFVTKFESFVNTTKWLATVNDNSEHLTVFVVGDRFGLLEGNAFRKLFIYRASFTLP